MSFGSIIGWIVAIGLGMWVIRKVQVSMRQARLDRKERQSDLYRWKQIADGNDQPAVEVLSDGHRKSRTDSGPIMDADNFMQHGIRLRKMILLMAPIEERAALVKQIDLLMLKLEACHNGIMTFGGYGTWVWNGKKWKFEDATNQQYKTYMQDAREILRPLVILADKVRSEHLDDAAEISNAVFDNLKT